LTADDGERFALDRSLSSTTVNQHHPRVQTGVCVTVVRSALEIAGVVVSLLLIVVGGGLTSDPRVLMMTAAGLSLSLMLAALLERWFKPVRVPAA
jgi:hypothetical protein